MNGYYAYADNKYKAANDNYENGRQKCTQTEGNADGVGGRGITYIRLEVEVVAAGEVALLQTITVIKILQATKLLQQAVLHTSLVTVVAQKILILHLRIHGV